MEEIQSERAKQEQESNQMLAAIQEENMSHERLIEKLRALVDDSAREITEAQQDAKMWKEQLETALS